MSFVAHEPGPPLQGLISLLWHATLDEPPALEWVLPSGAPQLLIQRSGGATSWLHGGENRVAGACVGGPFLAPIGVRGVDQQAVVGALFHPGGLAALLGEVPVRALQSTYVDLKELWGPDIGFWLDEVVTASSPQASLRALHLGLSRQVQRRSRRGALVRACGLLERGARVGTVAAELGASQRRFSRTFTDELGVTPKQFTRLARFQRAISVLRTEGAGDLAAVAHRAGFYDQAHLNHEFRAFAQLTPTEYLAGMGPYANHVRHVHTSDGDPS